jgi:hypothetical protein
VPYLLLLLLLLLLSSLPLSMASTLLLLPLLLRLLLHVWWRWLGVVCSMVPHMASHCCPALAIPLLPGPLLLLLVVMGRWRRAPGRSLRKLLLLLLPWAFLPTRPASWSVGTSPLPPCLGCRLLHVAACIMDASSSMTVQV